MCVPALHSIQEGVCVCVCVRVGLKINEFPDDNREHSRLRADRASEELIITHQYLYHDFELHKFSSDQYATSTDHTKVFTNFQVCTFWLLLTKYLIHHKKMVYWCN